MVDHEELARPWTLPPDDPRLQPYAKNPARAEKVIAACFIFAILCLAAFGASYWQAASERVMGGFLAVGLFALGFGIAAWGKYLTPRGPFEEPRHILHGTQLEQEAFQAAVVERAEVVIGRRPFLIKLLAMAGGITAVVMAFPLLRSLGPLPGKSLFHTPWRKGSRVVTASGRAITVDDLEVGGILTVFPEQAPGSAVAQTLLIRVATEPIVTQPGRETWGPAGYLAFSKVCTHAGCPVTLYEEQFQQLLCPCHQSLFDIYDGAVPVFGPAPRPLPQLPLMVDDQGYLRAQADYDQPIGPGFWERTTT